MRTERANTSIVIIYDCDQIEQAFLPSSARCVGCKMYGSKTVSTITFIFHARHAQEKNLKINCQILSISSERGIGLHLGVGVSFLWLVVLSHGEIDHGLQMLTVLRPKSDSSH